MQNNEQALYNASARHFQCDKPHRRTGRVKLMACLIVALLKLTAPAARQRFLSALVVGHQSAYATSLPLQTASAAPADRVYHSVPLLSPSLCPDCLATLPTGARGGTNPGSDSIPAGQPMDSVSGSRHCSSGYEHPPDRAFS